MMSKIKSRNAAKLKLLVVLPLASFLVLAFAEPRPAKSAGQPAVPVLQETAGQSQEEISKEKVAQAEIELQKLKEMEFVLREELKVTEDQEAKKELKMKLEATLHKRQEIETMLGTGGGALGVLEEAELKAQYKKLEQAELKLRDVLAKTDNPEKQAELKKELEQVLQKQDQVKTVLAAGIASANVEPSIEELKKEYAMLDQKAADVRAKLEKTQDPGQKADLENLLKKIASKQEMIKAQAMKIKALQKKD
jgi:DNA repair exonuclease SbcCD ATPase subunit